MDKKCYYPLVPLSYSYEALEDEISQYTLYFHHDKHLKTYVDNLNEALVGHPTLSCLPLETLLMNIKNLPQDIQDKVHKNGGGVYNHNLYFYRMTPNSQKYPTGSLARSMDAEFGSFAQFQETFTNSAKNVFGSGYTWLACKADGQLFIVNTANQDTILPLGLIPLTLIDVWEHAYYLDYQNRRSDYIKAWFELVDWKSMSEFYEDLL